MSKKNKKLEPYDSSNRRKFNYDDDGGYDKIKKFKKEKDLDSDNKWKKDKIRNLRKIKKFNFDV